MADVLAKRARALLDKISTKKEAFDADIRTRQEMEAFHENKRQAKEKHARACSETWRAFHLGKKARHEVLDESRKANAAQYYKWYQYYVRSVEARHRQKEEAARARREKVHRKWKRTKAKHNNLMASGASARERDRLERARQYKQKAEHAEYRLAKLEERKEREQQKRREYSEYVQAKKRQTKRREARETAVRQKGLLTSISNKNFAAEVREFQKEKYNRDHFNRRVREENLRHELNILWGKIERAKTNETVEAIHREVEKVVAKLNRLAASDSSPSWPNHTAKSRNELEFVRMSMDRS